MSLPSPYRAYPIGVATVGLNLAYEGVSAGWISLMAVEDLDSEVMSALSRAQTAIKEARSLVNGLSWHDAPASTRTEARDAGV